MTQSLRTRIKLRLNAPYQVDARQLAQATSPIAADVRELASRRGSGRHYATVDLHHRDLLELAVTHDITVTELISQLGGPHDVARGGKGRHPSIA